MAAAEQTTDSIYSAHLELREEIREVPAHDDPLVSVKAIEKAMAGSVPPQDHPSDGGRPLRG
jgi:hypothetical protein